MDLPQITYHQHNHTVSDFHPITLSDPAVYNIHLPPNNTGNDYNTVPVPHPHTASGIGMEQNSFHLPLPPFPPVFGETPPCNPL